MTGNAHVERSIVVHADAGAPPCDHARRDYDESCSDCGATWTTLIGLPPPPSMARPTRHRDRWWLSGGG